MKKTLIALTLALVLCVGIMSPTWVPLVSSPIAADDPAPSLVLKAPSTCVVGELVRLDLRESIIGGVQWRVLPETPDFEVIEDGRRAFFSSRVPGSYLFIVAGAKGDTALLTHHTIVVAGDVPGPGPGPNPPAVKTLAEQVTDAVKALPDYEGKATHVKGVAQVFRKMAEGSDISVDQILEATAVANSAVLGDKLEAWIPVLDKLGVLLDAMVDGGKLNTRDEYKATWLEIAKGLEATLPKGDV